jgi:hypothetical protein
MQIFSEPIKPIDAKPQIDNRNPDYVRQAHSVKVKDYTKVYYNQL